MTANQDNQSDSDASMASDDQLARYQAELLDILHAGSQGNALASQIDVSANAHLDEPIGHLDPALLEVAAKLTRTWGRLK